MLAAATLAPGGWAFILRCKQTGKELERSDGEPESTNNKMELTAVIRGLEALSEPCEVTLHADSTYVLQGMKSWMAGWKIARLETEGWIQAGAGQECRTLASSWTS